MDPRMMGRPMGRPWLQQLGQGLAQQRPMPMQQGVPPQGMPPQGMPPQAQGQGWPMQGPGGPMGQPGGPPPGAAFMRDQDAAIRAALARRRPPIPVQPGGIAGPQGQMPVQGAPEPDADQRGGMPDGGDRDDPRMQAMRGYR